MGQGSALSPILSALYIATIFHIFEKRTQNLLSSILIFILSFVNNGLFISQEKKSNMDIFCRYSITSSLFEQFGLTIKHSKLKVFHFSRFTKNFNSPYLDLSLLGGSVL